MRYDNLAYMVEIEMAKNVNNKIIPHHFLIETYHEILSNLGRMDDVLQIPTFGIRARAALSCVGGRNAGGYGCNSLCIV